MCHSVNRGGCMKSFPVWLSGPMFFKGGSIYRGWSPSRERGGSPFRDMPPVSASSDGHQNHGHGTHPSSCWYKYVNHLLIEKYTWSWIYDNILINILIKNWASVAQTVEHLTCDMMWVIQRPPVHMYMDESLWLPWKLDQVWPNVQNRLSEY